MSPADLTAAADPAPARVTDASVSGWGAGETAPAALARAITFEQLRATALAPAWSGAIARGMGRSYGDAAQLRDGLVLDMTALRGFELDAEAGIIRADAGVTLGRLLAALEPAGWVLPVLPGTQHVSVGGAIASDIHGKNHRVAGTFGSHVVALGLLTAAGDVLELTPERDPELLGATIGGMGLTGVILWAQIALEPLRSSIMTVDVDRFEQLDEALTLLDGPGGAHRVAWLDLLGRRSVRGVVTRADHAPASAAGVAGGAAGFAGGAAGVAGGAAATTVPARLTVPRAWPGGILRPGVVRAYNEYRFRHAPRRAVGLPEAMGTHYFPLDALDAWPRLYGSAGFVQYQLVVPRGQERAVEQVITRLRGSGVPCYLAVLKDFGAANDSPLSFPMEGWTLALDLPRACAGLPALLDDFDELVVAAGGRVYLAKDGRLRAETLAAMYPRLSQWRDVRDRVDPDGRWRSDLGERTGLVSAPDRAAATARAPVLAPGPALAPVPGSVPALTPVRALAPAPAPAGAHAPVPAPGAVNGGPAADAPPRRRVLLVGGSSEIGLAIVRRLRADGPVEACLLGRDPERLEHAAASLRLAGIGAVSCERVDAADLAAHAAGVGNAFAAMGGVDVAVVAVGMLGAQAGLDADPAEAAEVMGVTFLGTGSLLMHTLRRLRDQGHGTLIVLSSVAAERPRAANAVYGAAKAGLDALAQGLADATAGSGVRVLVVRPGFVTTRMTAGLKPAPMSAAPEEVADATVQALSGRAHTIWVPGRLRYVFAALRLVPRPLFRRLPL